MIALFETLSFDITTLSSKHSDKDCHQLVLTVSYLTNCTKLHLINHCHWLQLFCQCALQCQYYHYQTSQTQTKHTASSGLVMIQYQFLIASAELQNYGKWEISISALHFHLCVYLREISKL